MSGGVLSVDNFMFMEGFEGQDNLGCIKLGSSVGRIVLVFSEFVFGCEETEEFSSWAVLEEEVQLAFVLKAELHFDEEGMFYLGQDFFFGHNVFFLVFFDYVFLLEDLEGVELVVFEVSHEHDLGVGALPDYRQC